MSKKLILFILLCLLFSGFLFNIDRALAFCVDDSMCTGGVCVDNECVSQEVESSQQSGTSRTSVTSEESAPVFDIKPGIDQRCWEKNACIDYRVQILGENSSEAQDGFYSSKKYADAATACAGLGGEEEEWGFCLPVTQTITSISFGGRTEFVNLGDFIQTMYKYAIMAAGILAVILIMVAGMQWLSSGGSAEQINSARKRIGNALMGLFLAVCSYLILNIINPYLVNLRLPQTWLINSTNIAPVYCDMATEKLALAFVNGQTVTEKQLEERFKSITQSSYTLDGATQAECGNTYFVKDAGGETCIGNVCPKERRLCLDSEFMDTIKYKCEDYNLVGLIYASDRSEESFGSYWLEQIEGWEWPWVNGYVVLEAVCNDGSKSGNLVKSRAIPDVDKVRTEIYFLKISDEEIDGAVDNCKNNSGIKGFVLDISFNEDGTSIDEEHMIGYKGVDLGDFALFHKNAYDTTFVIVDKKYFISPEMLKKGLRMDIDVSKVCDIDDEDADRLKCYGYLGWGRK